MQNCIRLALDAGGNPIPPRVIHDDPFNATVVQPLVAEIELAPSTAQERPAAEPLEMRAGPCMMEPGR